MFLPALLAVSLFPAVALATSLPPGTPFHGKWEASQFQEDSNALLVKIRAPETVHWIDALKAESPPLALLKALFSSAQSGYTRPFGSQPEFEAEVDKACALHERVPARFLSTSMSAFHHPVYSRAAYHALPGVGTPDPSFPSPIDLSPVTAGAVYTEILPGDGPLKVAAAIVSCKDPKGARFARAQERAALTTLVMAQSNLAALSLKHYIKAGKDPKARQDSSDVLVRLIRLTARKARANCAWLRTPEARSGFTGLPDAPIPLLQDLQRLCDPEVARLERLIGEARTRYEQKGLTFPTEDALPESELARISSAPARALSSTGAQAKKE